MSGVRRVLSILFTLVPLAAAVALMPRFPAAVLAIDHVAQPLPGFWRVDPLAVVGVGVLGLAASRPRPWQQGFRMMLAVACLMSALLVVAPVVQLVLLVVASLLVMDGLGPRWFGAVALFAVATFGAPFLLPTGADTVAVPLAVLAVFVGVGGLPWMGRGGTFEAESALRPFWLASLLRTLTLEPWPVTLVVAATVAGMLALVAAAYGALRSPDTRHERTLAAVALMGFVAIGQNTTLGVAAGLWALTMVGVLAAGAAPSRARAMIAVCVAAWWTAGAVGAAGSFLAASLVWLASVVLGVAASLDASVAQRGRVGERAAVVLLGLALVAGMAWATNMVALPIAQQIGAGLTAPGLLDAWAFIGVSGMDAGHRRVTLLPAVVLAWLFVVAWAALWIVCRVTGRVRPALLHAPDGDEPSWRARVWWLR